MVTPSLCCVTCVLVSFLGFWIVPHNAFLAPGRPLALQSQLDYSQPEKDASAVENIRNYNSSSNPNDPTLTGGREKDPLAFLPQIYTYQKPRQKRRPRITSTRERKPRYYWHSSNNLREELYKFWEDLDVPIQRINPGQPPPIPSEHLLNFFNRNDLRWGIVQMGGRENVSHLLDGAKIIPGRWNQATELEEVKQLLPKMEDHRKQSDRNRRYMTKQSSLGDEEQNIEKTKQTNMISLRNNLPGGNSTTNLKLLSQASSDAPINASERQRKEFWSKEKAVKELYQYLESCRKYRQRPAVWMPRLSELSHEGYSKLFNACSRFEQLPCVAAFSSFEHQDEDLHSVAGLVTFQEWRFFESQLQLFVELQYYLDLHRDGSEEFFPQPSEVLVHGHSQLHDLIRIHGGKTMLAQKLDMKFAWDVSEITAGGDQVFATSTRSRHSNLSWGRFSLTFAIQLLQFIRSQYLSLDPPLSSTFISMPSETDLLRGGLNELALQVMAYGGYENVARRLGLAYFDGKSQQMEERRFRGAKLLWKERHNAGVLSGASTGSSQGNDSGRKRQGLPWDESLVITELHAYVKANMTRRSLPSTVMPRLRQLDEDERGDLRRAISKFGGVKHFCDKAGLISIDEWQKLE